MRFRLAAILFVLLGLAASVTEAQPRRRTRLIPEAPCVGTAITTSDNWQTIATAGGVNTTFCIQAGTHRLQSVTPVNGQKFIAVGNPIMSGARLLTSPIGSNPWVYTGQTQEGVTAGTCSTGFPECQHPEDVFIDSVPLLHVSTLGAVTTGTWFFNYATDTISIGTDPTGHVVEASVTPKAFISEGSTVTGVLIKGLIIEKYANTGNTSAIHAPNGSGWVVTGNTVRWNHAGGISLGTSCIVNRNYAHHNGQVAIGGYDADGCLFQNNEIFLNGAFFSPSWGAGGIKVTYQRHAVLVHNYVHHNMGGGIWCDIDCHDVLIEDNDVNDNDYFGIFYEISFNGTIHNNRVLRNGLLSPPGPAQAGIYTVSSQVVDISFNTVSGDNQGIITWMDMRGTSPAYAVAWESNNVTVHDNTICVATGNAEAAMVVNGFVDDTYYTSRGNSFTNNIYKGLSTGNFYWMYATRTFAVWQGTYSQDATGSRTVGATCP